MIALKEITKTGETYILVVMIGNEDKTYLISQLETVCQLLKVFKFNSSQVLSAIK